MRNILRNMKNYKRFVAAILCCLIVQAVCELGLPSYTSDIVDVGIEQGGIKDSVPEVLRESTLERLKLFLTGDGVQRLEENYQKIEVGDPGYLNQYPILERESVYLLRTEDNVIREQLNQDLGIALFLVSQMEEGSANEMMLNAIRKKGVEQFGMMSDSMTMQMGISVIKQEYEAIGIDLGKVQMDYLKQVGLKMLGISVIMMAAAILAGFFASVVGAGIGRDLRSRIFHKVVSFSSEDINRFSTASLITRSTNDIQQVQMVSTLLLRMVIYAPIIGIGGIIKVSGTRTGLGWIIFLAVALILLLVMSLMLLAMPKFKIMQDLVDRLNLVSREILTGLSVIRAFHREEYEEKRFEQANASLMQTQLFTNRVMTMMLPAMMLIMNGITLLIIWFGGKGIDAGKLQVGDMMAFISYTMMIVMSFLMLTMMSIMLPRAGVAAGRIQEVLEVETNLKDPAQPKKLEKTTRGTICFENVSFRYPNAKESALENISFTMEPGKTTAIIGSTGCGKTTLVHLMMRFYDVSEGRITFDGIDIRKLSQKELRDQIGLVPQKGVLFSGTIASNIKYADHTISDEQMKTAAKTAQAEEFILGKKEAYESPIAQGGSNVSGGQKQRLSIARAIAKQPRVYIFDDSFSALDYKTDAVLRSELAKQTKNSTVVIVAQRISTIMNADQIIVLDEGSIAGIGTHKELMQTCASYQEIARSQLSEEELKGGRAS